MNKSPPTTTATNAQINAINTQTEINRLKSLAEMREINIAKLEINVAKKDAQIAIQKAEIAALHSLLTATTSQVQQLRKRVSKLPSDAAKFKILQLTTINNK